jgi:hypothetical protein
MITVMLHHVVSLSCSLILLNLYTYQEFKVLQLNPSLHYHNPRWFAPKMDFNFWKCTERHWVINDSFIPLPNLEWLDGHFAGAVTVGYASLCYWIHSGLQYLENISCLSRKLHGSWWKAHVWSPRHWWESRLNSNLKCKKATSQQFIS